MKKYSVVINERATVSIMANDLQTAIGILNSLGVFITHNRLLSFLLERLEYDVSCEHALYGIEYCYKLLIEDV